MKKSVNPRALEIQSRFFEAFEYLSGIGMMPDGLKGFCEKHGFNRTKYSRIRNSLDRPAEERLYKIIDIDALSVLCGHYGVSAEWLLLGKGKMLKRDNKRTKQG